MTSCHIISLLFFTIFLLHIPLSSLLAAAAATSPSETPNSTTEFLQPHNQARAAVGVAALTWSPKLASSASLTARFQRDNGDCKFADLSNSSYGANQAWTSYPATPAQVVGSWVDVKKYYNYGNNSCDAAGQDQCGTYTQVVWRSTVAVGCAQVGCGTKKKPLKDAAMITICFYDPHGNVVGQRPY